MVPRQIILISALVLKVLPELLYLIEHEKTTEDLSGICFANYITKRILFEINCVLIS